MMMMSASPKSLGSEEYSAWDRGTHFLIRQFARRVYPTLTRLNLGHRYVKPNGTGMLTKFNHKGKPNITKPITATVFTTFSYSKIYKFDWKQVKCLERIPFRPTAP
jgi:hypothetical protein